jgi:UDPglucose 6-dehydrogenase
MREAPSVVIIKALLEVGANIRAFDPIAINEAKSHYLGDAIYYAKNIYDAAQGADAIALVTEWKQFRVPNWSRIKESMCGNIVVDGRNIYTQSEMEELGFKYYSIGK